MVDNHGERGQSSQDVKREKAANGRLDGLRTFTPLLRYVALVNRRRVQAVLDVCQRN